MGKITDFYQCNNKEEMQYLVSKGFEYLNSRLIKVIGTRVYFFEKSNELEVELKNYNR